MVLLSSSGLRNVRGRSTTIIIVASAAVISLLFFLPLTVSANHNTLLQSQSAFAQPAGQQQGDTQSGGQNPLSSLEEGLQNLLSGNQSGGGGSISDQQQGGVANQSGAGGPLSGTFENPPGAQQQEERAFLPYLNPIHRIFMQYPSNWIASTSGLADYTDLVAFYSPLQNFSDIFPARLTLSVISYDQNVSLPEYTNDVLTRLNQSDQVDVRSSSEVTVAGYPGHRVVLAIQPFQNSTLVFDQMSTWTTIGNNVYRLTYQGVEPRFNQYLPEVSQMLESLRLDITAPITGENLVQ